VAYKASLTNAHPPLYFVLLYYWRFVGYSETMLRLPSILAGAAACWMAFRWIALALGKTAGLIALLLLTFSPALILASAEVRAYSLLLLWMTASLYFLERALRDQRVSSIAYYSLFLCLAILTHYSALWFVLAAGIYVLVRMGALSSRSRIAWALFQIAAAAIYAWLYVTHISKLRGSPMERDAETGWLRGLYFQHGQMSAASFLRTASLGLFEFLSSSHAGGFVLLLFLAGLLWLATAGFLKNRPDLAAFGLFLLLPFALNFGGSLLDVYPYGGTRHCIYLALFAAAGVSFLAAKAVQQKLLPALLLAALIMPYWHRRHLPDPQAMNPKEQRKVLMTDALDYLHAAVPPEQPLFTDYQASILLAYYLGRDQPPPPAIQCGGATEMRYGPYRVVVTGGWSATAAEMVTSLNRWRSMCSATPTDSFWIFDAGWGLNLLDDMKAAAPQSVSQARRYGEVISLFKFRLDR
jgi:hypothetical protein